MKNVLKTTAILALALCACASPSSAQTATSGSAKDHLAEIKERGTLIVGLEGDWQPFSFEDDNGIIVGYDTDVATEIANRIGVAAEIVPTAWEGLLAGLETGVFDMVVNGVDVTPDREETFTFSDPYAYDKTVLIVKEDNEEIKQFEDLKGKLTSNSIGSTYMELGEKYGAEVRGVDTLAETLELVKNGTVDATINANTSFQDYMNTVGGPFKVVDASDTVKYAIPMRKLSDGSNDAFVAAVNQALNDMRADGTLKELSIKYFGEDLTNE